MTEIVLNLIKPFTKITCISLAAIHFLNFLTYFSFRLSYLDQSTLLNSNMKKYLQYAKAYVISQNFEYDEGYFNSIDIEAQFIG